ncbi:hypothetical protein Bca4012_065206 [Brassica carinata]
MAAPQISLSDLRPGRCVRIIVARLIRFWEARNGGELMGVDILLLDLDSTATNLCSKMPPLTNLGILATGSHNLTPLHNPMHSS